MKNYRFIVALLTTLPNKNAFVYNDAIKYFFLALKGLCVPI